MFIRSLILFFIITLFPVKGADSPCPERGGLEALQGLYQNTRDEYKNLSPAYAKLFVQTMLPGIRFSGIYGRFSDDPEVAKKEWAWTHPRLIHGHKKILEGLQVVCLEVRFAYYDLYNSYLPTDKGMVGTDDSSIVKFWELNILGVMGHIEHFLRINMDNEIRAREERRKLGFRHPGIRYLDVYYDNESYGKIEYRLDELAREKLSLEQSLEKLSYVFQDAPKNAIASWIQNFFTAPYSMVVTANRRTDSPFARLVLQDGLGAINDLILLIFDYKKGQVTDELFTQRVDKILSDFVFWYKEKTFKKGRSTENGEPLPEFTGKQQKEFLVEGKFIGEVLLQALKEETLIANASLPESQILPENIVLLTLLGYIGEFRRSDAIYYQLTSLMKPEQDRVKLNAEDLWGPETYGEITRKPKALFAPEDPKAVERLCYALMKFNTMERLTPPGTPSISVRLPGCPKFSNCTEMTIYDFFRFFLYRDGALHPELFERVIFNYPHLEKNELFNRIVEFFKKHSDINAAHDPEVHKEWTLILSGLFDPIDGNLVVLYILVDKNNIPRYELAGGLRSVLNIFTKILGGKQQEKPYRQCNTILGNRRIYVSKIEELLKPWFKDEGRNRKLYFSKLKELCSVFYPDSFDLRARDLSVLPSDQEISGNYCTLHFFYKDRNAFVWDLGINHTDMVTRWKSNKKTWKHKVPIGLINKLPDFLKFQFLDVQKINFWDETALPTFYHFYNPKYLGARESQSFTQKFFDVDLHENPVYWPLAGRLVQRNGGYSLSNHLLYITLWKKSDSDFVRNFYPRYLSRIDRQSFVRKMFDHLSEAESSRVSFKRLLEGPLKMTELDSIMASLIRENGIDLRISLPDSTLFFKACKQGYVETVKVLMDISPEDVKRISYFWGLTPVEVARENQHWDIVELLGGVKEEPRKIYEDDVFASRRGRGIGSEA